MKTNTGLTDSYNEPIYEGDVIYDEVGDFFNYVVRHNGRWYASHSPEGDVLNGSIEGGYGRRCQAIHTGPESVAELWRAHRNRDLKEEQLLAKITDLENLVTDLQHDNGQLSAEVGAQRDMLIKVCEAIVTILDGSQPIDTVGAAMVAKYAMAKMRGEYEAFEAWCNANGFADVTASEPETINLDRLHQAIKAYGQAVEPAQTVEVSEDSPF